MGFMGRVLLLEGLGDRGLCVLEVDSVFVVIVEVGNCGLHDDNVVHWRQVEGEAVSVDLWLVSCATPWWWRRWWQ
jgi:hypothetical protein